MKTVTKLLFLLTFIICTSLIKAQNYDYLIISPDIFLQNASWDNELILLQLSRGFHPVIATVELGFTNEQIRDIIENYYNTNPIKYVLLIGSGKNLEIPHEGESPDIPYEWTSHGTINIDVDYLTGTYIPFFSVTSNNPWDPAGTTDVATDDPYVSALTSHGSVYIGRIPVTSIEEASNYVNKLQTYYQFLDDYSTSMENEILLNCDITHPGNGCTGETVRYLDAQLVNEHIPSYVSIVDLKVSDNYDVNCDYPENWHTYLYCPSRQSTFEDNLNPGASIMSVLSTTGGPESFGGWYWAVDNRDPENKIPIDFNLTNINTAIPFVIAPNCDQGEVMSPDLESTMRKLMVYDDGGIIGSIAPTNGSEQLANGYVLNRFNDMIFQDHELTYGEIFKTLKTELASNYSWWEYYYNSLTFFGDPSMTPSIYKHRSGTLAASTTWSGNFVIDNSVTVPTGHTLTILPGTNLFFKNGSSLIVEGGLDARGTSTKYITFNKDNTTGNWGNITFTTPARSLPNSSTLKYTKVKNATSISCLNNAIVTIENSRIENCTNGIYIYNTQPNIKNNEIISPNANGIYGEASGKSPIIQGNHILKYSNNPNYHSYQGIYLYNSTNPFITENDIQGFYYGIYYGGGGIGYLTDYSFTTPQINNRFTDDRYGLTVAWGSYLFAGAYTHTDPPELIANFNSIYNNIVNDASAYQYGTILAEQNWWGEDGPQIDTYDFGFIDCDDPLDYDPWGGPPPGNTVMNKMTLNPSEINDDILLCITLEKQERISELITLCKQMLTQNVYPKFALTELIKVKHRYHINNIEEYLDSLLTINPSFKAVLMNHLASLALEKDRYGVAMLLYNRIITEFPNSREAVNALFEKFFAALIYKNDRTTAEELLSELESLGLTDVDFLMRLDIAESLFNNGPGGSKMGKTIASSENKPKHYALLGNYPNPFNPTTKISYVLPYISSVELVVYDILGRQVKNFNLTSQPSGTQSITWDGTNNYNTPVASGVYLYMINIKSLENNETFTKTSKLMLLK
jgi:parallel beta-helix repeat protein